MVCVCACTRVCFLCFVRCACLCVRARVSKKSKRVKCWNLQVQVTKGHVFACDVSRAMPIMCICVICAREQEQESMNFCDCTSAVDPELCLYIWCESYHTQKRVMSHMWTRYVSGANFKEGLPWFIMNSLTTYIYIYIYIYIYMYISFDTLAHICISIHYIICTNIHFHIYIYTYGLTQIYTYTFYRAFYYL